MTTISLEDLSSGKHPNLAQHFSLYLHVRAMLNMTGSERRWGEGKRAFLLAHSHELPLQAFPVPAVHIFQQKLTICSSSQEPRQQQKSCPVLGRSQVQARLLLLSACWDRTSQNKQLGSCSSISTAWVPGVWFLLVSRNKPTGHKN